MSLPIRRVHLAGVMSHTETTLTLPRTGLVLVQGPNGAGKSAVFEAVATALYGETLRGAPPWDGAGRVEVETYDGLTAVRAKTKSGSPTLTWDLDGLPNAYATTTQAQVALESATESMESWVRSSVFTPATVGRFATATDGERKRFLETVLGMDRFDAALDKAKEKVRRAEDTLQRATTAHARAEASRDACAAALERARQAAAPADHEDPATLRAQLAKLEEEVAPRAEGVTTVRADLATRRAALAQLEAHVRHAQSEANRADPPAACDACGRPFDSVESFAAHREAAAQRLSDLRAQMRPLQTEIDSLDGLLLSVQAAVRRATEEVGALRSRLSLAERADAAARAHADAEGQAERALSEAERALVHALVPVAAARVDVDTARAVANVYGLRGVRAHVLAHALAGIESTANGWLARVAGADLRVKFSPYTPKKSGDGVKDEIRMEVLGAGGGHGYKAASDGERRRIDLALLLALGEVCDAAAGRPHGTLFLDEVLDSSLDPEGTDAICETLAEVAATRCVVLITHADAVLARLASCAVQRWFVSQGKVAVSS